MNRKLACKFPQYQYINLDAEANSYVYYEIPQSVAPTDLDEIFKEVFAVDPVSGLPKGDMQYYLSKDGNPMVKQWLENNLLSPRAKQDGTSIAGVTDDLIAEMSRNDDESTDDYRSRLMSIYDEAKSNYASFLAQQHKTE